MQRDALNIVLATDGSENAMAASALLAAVRIPPAALVKPLAVVTQSWSLVGIGLETRIELHETLDRLRRVSHAAARADATRAAQPLQAVGLATAVEVHEGAPAQAILALAAEWPADLIALGARGYSLGDDRQLGATARQVVRNAKSSVLLARPRRSSGPLRLLVAIDGLTNVVALQQSLQSLVPVRGEPAVEVLVASLAGRPANVPRSNNEWLAKRPAKELTELRSLEVGEAIQSMGAQVRNLYPTGEPRAELIRLARASLADLVVVAPGGEAGRLGALAWAAIKYSPCSVLVARPRRTNLGYQAAIAMPSSATAASELVPTT